MAQVVTRTFVDDIDGSVAERTFTFSVDGDAYEIDLSSANIEEFHSAVGGFVESARKVKTSKVGRPRGVSSAAGARSSREHLTAVREWARKNGHNVSDRGRISAEVLQAFEQAHGRSLTAVG